MGRLNDPDQLGRLLQAGEESRRPLGVGFDDQGSSPPRRTEDPATPDPAAAAAETAAAASGRAGAGRVSASSGQAGGDFSALSPLESRLRSFVHWRAEFQTAHPDLPAVPLLADGNALDGYLSAALSHPSRRGGAPLPRTVHRLWRRHIALTIQRPPTTLPPGARTRQDQGVSVAVTFQALHTVARTPPDRLAEVVATLADLQLFDREVEQSQFVPFMLPAPAAEGYDALLSQLVGGGVLRHGWQLQLTIWLYTLPLGAARSAPPSGLAQLDALANVHT